MLRRCSEKKERAAVRSFPPANPPTCWEVMPEDYLTDLCALSNSDYTVWESLVKGRSLLCPFP